MTAEIDPIYQHLVGAKHRTKYIKNILGQQVIKLKVINLSKITVNRVSNKIEGCGHFTIKWLTVIFDRLSGLISRIIREIKILFDNSLIVSGVSLSEVKIGDNPADILLNNIANASCKNEDDAKLSYEVAHRLILKLAEYVTEKAANPVKVSRNIMINQNSCSYLLLCFVKVFFVKSIPQKKKLWGN